MVRSAPTIALAALLAGCTGAGSSTGAAAPDAALAANASSVALEVGEGLYQEPIGYDAGGCLMYRIFSPATMVTHAISYRSIDGGFTLKRRYALCASEPQDQAAVPAR